MFETHGIGETPSSLERYLIITTVVIVVKDKSKRNFKDSYRTAKMKHCALCDWSDRLELFAVAA